MADTADLERLARLPGEVEARFGPVEILVTNTGGPPLGRALDADLDEWRNAYRSLVLAPRVLIEAVLPGMRERGWGRIVNVGSSSTREPIAGLALSNSHRPALIGFLKTLAGEVAADGVTVNDVATGRFATDRLAANWGGWEETERGAARGPRRAARPTRRSTATWSPSSPRSAPPTSPGRRSRSTAGCCARPSGSAEAAGAAGEGRERAGSPAAV